MADDKALSLNNGLPAIRNWTREKFVEKEAGEGSSDNSYSASEKSKLARIATGAEVNVQTDWAVVGTGSDAYTERKLTSMPADGGNAATVDGHIVAIDVPAGAVFTDTRSVAMKEAAANAVGVAGYAPSPATRAQGKYLHGDGTWQTSSDITYSATTQSANGLMTAADKKKLDGFQEAANYALKIDIVDVHHYKNNVADGAALPTTNISVGDVHSIEAESSYEPADTSVAWISDRTWDNSGGNFIIDFTAVVEVSTILNAQEGAQGMKALSTGIIVTTRDWTKAYVNNNRFDTTYLRTDAPIGYLQAHQDANLEFALLSDGHLKNEVI